MWLQTIFLKARDLTSVVYLRKAVQLFQIFSAPHAISAVSSQSRTQNKQFLSFCFTHFNIDFSIDFCKLNFSHKCQDNFSANIQGPKFTKCFNPSSVHSQELCKWIYICTTSRPVPRIEIMSNLVPHCFFRSTTVSSHNTAWWDGG